MRRGVKLGGGGAAPRGVKTRRRAAPQITANVTVIEIMRVNFSFTYVRISNLVFFVSPVRRHKYVGALEAEPRRTMFQPEAAGLSSRADLQKGSPAFTTAGRSRELGGCILEGIFDWVQIYFLKLGVWVLTFFLQKRPG